jgi:ribosomal protein L4
MNNKRKLKARDYKTQTNAKERSKAISMVNFSKADPTLQVPAGLLL